MPKTNQEIFDEVVTGLFEQGGPARSPDSKMCLYRAPDGRKCAFGLLIPDSAYEPLMEGNNAEAVIRHFNVGEYSREQIELVTILQEAHDRWSNGQWRNEVFYPGWTKEDPQWTLLRDGLAHVASIYELQRDLLDHHYKETGYAASAK